MILKQKLGKTPKSLMKLPNGMLMDVLRLQFHHGNILFLVEVAEVSLKEATELAASMLMIHGSSILIT